MANFDLGVFMHELNHAVHGPWIIDNETWEEGMARAEEVAEMNLFASWGVTATSSYFDLHRSYGYDEFYENYNTPNVGNFYGTVYSPPADPGLVLLRYQEAGYAFGKILIEKPDALREFNALLFQQPNGNLTVANFSRSPDVIGKTDSRANILRQVVRRSEHLQCCSSYRLPTLSASEHLSR